MQVAGSSRRSLTRKRSEVQILYRPHRTLLPDAWREQSWLDGGDFNPRGQFAASDPSSGLARCASPIEDRSAERPHHRITWAAKLRSFVPVRSVPSSCPGSTGMPAAHDRGSRGSHTSRPPIQEPRYRSRVCSERVITGLPRHLRPLPAAVARHPVERGEMARQDLASPARGAAYYP